MSSTPTDVGAAFAMFLLVVLSLIGTLTFGIAACWIPVLIIPTCMCGAIAVLAAYRIFK